MVKEWGTLLFYSQMITFATLPKPMVGHFGVIQRNAIRSWMQMTPAPEILLFGNDEGVAEFGLRHFPEMYRNEFGTPLINKLLDHAQREAKNGLFCYVNADIFLFPEFTEAVKRSADFAKHFLMIGDTRCCDIKTLIDFDSPLWEQDVRRRAFESGSRWRIVGMDYFVFPRGQFSHMPPFAVRPYFDNWFVWDGRQQGIPVIDATKFALAIHQEHPYPPMVGQQPGMHKGTEAQINLELLGGKDRAYRLMESDFKMTSGGVVRRSFYGTFCVRMKRDALKRKLKKIIYFFVRPVLQLVRR